MTNKLNELVVLCIYCNKPWTAEMKMTELSSSGGCDTCGYGKEYNYCVEIYCTHCGKLVYKKEGDKVD